MNATVPHASPRMPRPSMRARALLVGTLCVSLLLGCANAPVTVINLPPKHTGTNRWLPKSYGVTKTAPYYIEGERRGIRIDEITRDSLAHRMGLRTGDIIREMADIPCNTLRRCRTGSRRMRSALNRQKPFSVILERAGATMKLVYKYGVYKPLAL